MEIYDVQGSLVYTKEFYSGENGGRRGPDNNISWDGKNLNMKPVASGVYICRIVASDKKGEKEWAFKKLAILR